MIVFTWIKKILHTIKKKFKKIFKRKRKANKDDPFIYE